MLSPATIVLLLATLVGADPSRPVDVFAELDGTWTGTFVGYDAEGRELYRIGVRQTYETVSATTQSVRIEDRMPDGTVITGTGRNVAERRPEGGLALRCIVDKSNGDHVEHDGRLGRAVDGSPQIIWHSNRPDRVETFRESVRHEGDRIVYEINGMGRYGKTLVLMHGRYVKTPPATPTPAPTPTPADRSPDH